MKKHIYILAFLASLISFACQENPLIKLEDDVSGNVTKLEIEYLAANQENNLIDGFDSTYIVSTSKNQLRDLDGYIYVAKIVKENKRFGNTIKNSIDLFEAEFFDKNREILTPEGNFLGYFSIPIGEFLIDNAKAILTGKIIKLRRNNQMYEAKAGARYFLYKSPFLQIGENFQLAYNSPIYVKVLRPNHINEFINFIPEEINGELKINYNLKEFESLEISWNKSLGGSNLRGKVEIVIGVFIEKTNSAFPIIRIRTDDIGTIKLPARIFENIRINENFDLIFLISKKNVKKISLNNNFQNIDFIAASVYSIKVKKFY